MKIRKPITECPTFEAECAGLIVRGEVKCDDTSYVAEIEIKVDGGEAEIIRMPADWNIRKLEVYYNLCLEAGAHTLQMRWLNPVKGASININDVLLLDKE